MIENAVNGSRIGARSGAQTLVLLATPLNVLILRALASGPPMTQTAIRREAGSPAQSTLRSHLNGLEGAGVIAKRKQSSFPGTLEYELEDSGSELHFVADTLERWLAEAPYGALALGGEPARSAVKALVEGWSTTIAGILAAKPLSLTELDRLIPGVSYPSLERRLGTMRAVGQIETLPGGARGTPYAVTAWLRRGVAPLVAAAAWERRNSSVATASIDRLDVEAAFMLTLPLLELSPELFGECRLTVEIPNANGGDLPGVVAKAEGGSIAAQDPDERGDANAWATGSISAWLSAVIEDDASHLELGGDSSLTLEILGGLHSALFDVGPSGLQAIPK